MKKLLLIIIMLTSYPVFSACRIDSDSTSCIAEFQPDIVQPIQNLNSAQPQKESALFTETPSSLDLTREIKPVKTRDFGSNNTEYGYNSSCQFGVCMDTGTPKIFGSGNNTSE